MESRDSGDSESDEDCWTLDTLPPEVILHIFSFLPSKFVINVVSQVCKLFENIIENDITWKMKIFERWPKKYPMVPSIVDEIDWKIACIEREEQHRMWSNFSDNMRRYHFPEAHFGCVNVIKIINDGDICVTGGRDGNIKIWNIQPSVLQDQPFNSEFEFVNADSCLVNSSNHATAWLWDITYNYHSSHLFSCGFDCNIKSWDMTNPADVHMTYKFSSPVLCLDYFQNLLTAGSFGRNVTVFDQRTELTRPAFIHNQHKKSVLCLAIDDKYVISGSEDKSVIIFDFAAGKILKRLEFANFPLSMSYGQGQLFVGGVSGDLHVIDPAQGQFDLLQTFPSGHKKKVTGVQHSLGSIITSSTDQTIRVLEPNIDPEPIALLNCTNEVAGISFCNNILGSANTDDSITLWVPNELFD